MSEFAWFKTGRGPLPATVEAYSSVVFPVNNAG